MGKRRSRSESIAIFILLGLLAICIPAYGGAVTQQSAELKQAKNLYYRAVTGDESARKQSAAEFARLAESDPDDPEVMAYSGSLSLMEAGKTWAVWRRYEYSKKGITLLDEAVARAPDNLEVRFVRAATTRKLPVFFERRQQSKDDLAFLSTRVSSAARKGQLDPDLAAAALYFYAKDVATGEQKTKALQQAVKIAPESHAGVQAAAALSHSDK